MSELDDKPWDCQFEVTKYFECVQKYKDSDDVLIKNKCFTFIDAYHKCIDFRDYNKCLEKKKARYLKKQENVFLTEMSNKDYEQYILNL